MFLKYVIWIEVLFYLFLISFLYILIVEIHIIKIIAKYIHIICFRN